MDKIYVTRPSVPDLQEYIDEIRSCWDSKWFSNMGEKHQLLEKKLKELFGLEVTLFSNGHLALEAAIEEMDLPAGSEVITTPFTFASTTNAIIRKNLVPVFCDIRSDDFTIDASKIEKLITPKTRAIIPVHVYGNVCDVEEIESIARKHDLKVIYDAAHAFGVNYKTQPVVKFGYASVMSFHATKVFNTIEGGAVFYSDNNRSRNYDLIKNHGISDEENIDYPGGNSKLNELSAAMGLCNLRHFDENLVKRKELFEEYKRRLAGVEGIILPSENKETESNYSYFPVVFDSFKLSRDEVKEVLSKNNIEARKYFYPLTCDSSYIREKYDVCDDDLSVARFVAERVLTLPLYAELTKDDVNRICDIILGDISEGFNV